MHLWSLNMLNETHFITHTLLCEWHHDVCDLLISPLGRQWVLHKGSQELRLYCRMVLQKLPEEHFRTFYCRNNEQIQGIYFPDWHNTGFPDCTMSKYSQWACTETWCHMFRGEIKQKVSKSTTHRNQYETMRHHTSNSSSYMMRLRHCVSVVNLKPGSMGKYSMFFSYCKASCVWSKTTAPRLDWLCDSWSYWMSVIPNQSNLAGQVSLVSGSCMPFRKLAH